ncbi:site-specific DNA-methyltransferase [Brevundimonas sp. LF-1]|uniref:DNA-methyltransferase n=1 Tax=Brevundimonas sp. LF-1 TaxID=3126100 RepID=UPI0030E56064
MNNRRQKLAEIKQGPVANDNCPTITPPPSAPSARLLKGECVATMSAMASESVDLIVTSPPYMNIGMPYGDDFQSIEDYVEFSRQWITAAARVLKPGGSMWINVGMHKAGPNSRVPLTYYLFPLIAATGLTFVQEIVWDRRAQQNTTQRFATRSERWLYLVKPGVLKGGRGRPKVIHPTFNLDDVRRPSTSKDKRNNPAGANPADIWEFTQVHGTAKERTEHPCPFPVAMIERIVLACSNPGDVVLDPFGGSGTTGAAAMAHGRSSVMIEREPTYWPIIEKRLGLVDRVVVGSTEAGADLFAEFHHGDAIQKMKLIPSQSVNLILCDPPYGTTAVEWDEVLPAADLWREYKRILAPGGMIVLHAAQPFTTDLIMSNRSWFSQHLIWEKSRASGFYHAKRRHMAAHEDVLVFKRPGAKTTFNPQGVVKKEPQLVRRANAGKVYASNPATNEWINDSSNYPRSVLKFKSERTHGHPTQKPQALAEYLIRTFSNPGDVVLDHCFGSGTTGAAAMVAGRSFIGVERDDEWFAKGRARVLAAAGTDELPSPTTPVAANDDATAAKATDDCSGARVAQSAARPDKSSDDIVRVGTTKRVAQRGTIANDNRPTSDVIRYGTVCSGSRG